MATDTNQLDKRTTVIDCVALAALYIFMLVCSNAWGNFPLNDDWNYGFTVKALLDEHKVIVTQWSLAASFTHILLGYLLCAIFGFSFDTLRVGTMLCGFGAIATLYILSARLGVSRAIRLLAAATLATNPLFFNLATTYMTDVPFLFLAGIFLIFAINNRPAASTMAAIFSVLTRQTGVVLPLAFALTGVPDRRWIKALPLVASIIATTIFQTWLGTTSGTLYSYQAERAWIQMQLAQGIVHVIENCAMNFISALVYLGAFLFPLMIVLYPQFLSGLEGKQKKFAITMFLEPLILIGLGLILTHSLMPLGDNILFDLGLGPVLLGGTEPNILAKGPTVFWVLVTTCGVIGASAIISMLVILIQRRAASPVLFMSFCFYLAVIMFRGFFDRYLLFPMFLLAPVLALAGQATTSRTKILLPMASLTLLLFATFAVAGTHDYFAWNRARWQAAKDLVEIKQISPLDIDGGLEFNGWYGYQPRYRHLGGVVMSTDMRHGDKYLLRMQPIGGYTAASRYAFQRWLPWGSGEIVVLEKSK